MIPERVLRTAKAAASAAHARLAEIIWPIEPKYAIGLVLNAAGSAVTATCAFKGSVRGALLGMALGTVGGTLLLFEPLQKKRTE